jgi:hypothetical protein
MRFFLFLGLGFAALGGYILVRGMTYTTNRRVLEVGDFKASLEERQTAPTWVGGVALAVGLGLIVLGARRRS